MKTALLHALIVILSSISPILAAELSTTHDEYTHTDALEINPQLTLHDVLVKVVQRLPQQATLNAQQFQVMAKQKTAQSLFPQAPSVGAFHQNDVIGSGRQELDMQAELELPIWLPKQRTSREKVAHLSASTWDANAESLQIQGAGILRDTLWTIALNRNDVLLYQEKWQQAQWLQSDIQRKYDAGELAKTDLMLVQQETLNAQKSLVRAKAELMHSQFRYQQITGISDIPAVFDETQSTLEDYQQSPLWKAAEARVQQAQGERDLSIVERRENPQIILNARNSRGAFDNAFNQSVGFRIRIPLDTEVRSAPILAASEQVLGDALMQREHLKLALENALHEAEHNLQVSKQELSISQQHADIAKNSLALAKKAFQLGEIDLMTLLRIQTQSFESERSHTARQLQVQWDIAKYNQAVGVIP